MQLAIKNILALHQSGKGTAPGVSTFNIKISTHRMAKKLSFIEIKLWAHDWVIAGFAYLKSWKINWKHLPEGEEKLDWVRFWSSICAICTSSTTSSKEPRSEVVTCEPWTVTEKLDELSYNFFLSLSLLISCSFQSFS